MENVQLVLPIWGILTVAGGFVATAVTVVVGVLVSNRDLRTTIASLDRTTERLGNKVDELDGAVGRLLGLDARFSREVDRGDDVHSAIFRRIERLEQRVFDNGDR